MAANQEIDALLQELNRLVSTALGSSDQLAILLDRLFRQGYSLRLDVDGGANRNSFKLVLTPRRPVPPAVPAAEPPAAEPPILERPQKPFRLDASDVALLRSLGIDGTRRASRNRRS